jgi:beta-N-acetylhexosaminidase
MSLVKTCGALVIGGFPGTALPPDFEAALRQGRRGGAILFRPNLEAGTRQVAALAHAVHACSTDAPALVGIDQEGGRVARLKAPLLDIPAMRTVAAWRDPSLAERVASAVGAELAALGFTIDFAPVLDVNTCADNPVIGDRAFGDDPETCARYGAAWIRGLQSAGILACGKHFPGHGDTAKDSHVDLPVVHQPADRIRGVELTPFRAAVDAGVASMMTAHVIYTAFDSTRPATLSPAIATDLRREIGFTGVLISDDLEMQAIAARMPIAHAAVSAVAAGCDALLVCWSWEKQEMAVEALVREAEASPAFRARCVEACERVMKARHSIRASPVPVDHAAAVGQSPESRAVAALVAGKLRA